MSELPDTRGSREPVHGIVQVLPYVCMYSYAREGSLMMMMAGEGKAGE